MIVHGARDITSLGEAARAFAQSSSGRVIAAATFLAAAVRVGLGNWSLIDGLAVLAVVIALGPVEWIIHRRLLHAEAGSMLAEVLGTRDSHERHHRDPDDMEWLLLRRPNAIGSCLAIIAPVVAAVEGLAVGLHCRRVAERCILGPGDRCHRRVRRTRCTAPLRVGPPARAFALPTPLPLLLPARQEPPAPSFSERDLLAGGHDRHRRPAGTDPSGGPLSRAAERDGTRTLG